MRKIFAIIFLAGLLSTTFVSAIGQLTNLYSFSYCYGTNADGANPYAPLTSAGGMLWGVAFNGGTNGSGTIFSLSGTNLTVRHQFTNSVTDGANPEGGLVASNNTLYGTASAGNSNNWGSVLSILTNGTGFTEVAGFGRGTFTGGLTNTACPAFTSLIQTNNTLYGTSLGNSAVAGSIFNVSNTTVVPQTFTVTHGVQLTGATQVGSNFVCTTYSGEYGYGSVFSINTNGTGYTVLHEFTNTTDGAHPYGGVAQIGSTLYGTASGGGAHGNGTLWSVTTTGTGFTNFYNFSAFNSITNTNTLSYTNWDGASPRAGLIIWSNLLCGTAFVGGTNGEGTVFVCSTNGSMTNLFNFSYALGSQPWASLLLTNNVLYGTASQGGSYGSGSIFSLSP